MNKLRSTVTAKSSIFAARIQCILMRKGPALPSVDCSLSGANPQLLPTHSQIVSITFQVRIPSALAEYSETCVSGWFRSNPFPFPYPYPYPDLGMWRLKVNRSMADGDGNGDGDESPVSLTQPETQVPKFLIPNS